MIVCVRMIRVHLYIEHKIHILAFIRNLCGNETYDLNAFHAKSYTRLSGDSSGYDFYIEIE